ncbi:AraC family transcriptional regulator [Paracidovorax anthurii]|uniref:AraC family transcriptional regulator n=1 Tax=Paracidovorax anthurii TaxID=78229 RepID=A0A328ZL22_9BURK|nr:AraC family transcriptional regulator [Paracidovorax anthurii]RAR86569.1 AraC family transcriptional regulator [Paracidovorax anthurii]
MRGDAIDPVRISPAFWEGVRRVGVDPAALIRRSKLPLQALAEGRRVKTHHYFAVWQALAEMAGDAGIGLRMAAAVDASVMPPTFIMAQHARDLRDALRRIARFKHLCAPEEVVLEESPGACSIEVRWLPTGIRPPDDLTDAVLAALLRLARHGTGREIRALRVELARAQPAHSGHERFFGGPVRWRSTGNRLVLHGADLDLAFTTYNADLLAILTPALEAESAKLQSGLRIADRVRWVLHRLMSAGRPEVDAVAAELSMSGRSLQRRLTVEGVTFQSLLQETRQRLARQYLQDPQLDLAEVACLLGYEDGNSFHRAFRQWERQSPGDWRALALDTGPGPDRSERIALKPA